VAAVSPSQVVDAEIPPLTVDDLDGRDLPERWELVEGRIVEVAAAGGRSSRTGGRAYSALLEQGERRGLGWAYPADAGFVLFPDRRTMRSPDAAFIRIERLPDPEDPAFVALAPDLVVEVLSPSDRRGDALAKIGMYLNAGVRLAWLADPDRKTVTVFTTDAPPFTLAVGDTLDGDDVLPDLRIAVADLFAP
jgi:Uma2 family endonuclease